MNYLHHPYAYTGHPAIPMDQPVSFDPAMTHPAMIHPMDGYLYPHPPFDMVDYYHQPIMDYEEYAENLSRPRLTKEQVETLEAQFQAHPKPSSNVKRQLAAQTNLSLPRVANWFQNRRAKAKQQKRQEEFERMQKAKAEAEEAVRGKPEDAENSDAPRDTTTVKEETPKETPKPSEPSVERPKPKSSRSKHQKTRSESAREATFASLQRALNAAVAARECYGENDTVPEGSASPIPASATKSTPELGGPNETTPAFADWESVKDSTAWGPSHSPESLAYGNLDAVSLASADSLSVPEFHAPQPEEWTSQAQTSASVPAYTAASQADTYHAGPYPLPQQTLSHSKSSDELADSLEGIEIDSQMAHSAETSSWKENAKELDLAARRKRPRPAAIGTSRSSSSLLGAAASMSPTARAPSYGAVRQSKSAQNLNARYAGVRKASAAQRSPLNMSTFAEAGAALASAKAEMLHPITTGALAPPTPLTPEDFQHLLPTSPSDGGYCLSAHPTSQLFPTTQPMQINVASPPATPMMDMMSSYAYPGVAPPMSAPAHYTSFPDYASCDAPRSWTDATSMPSPEASFHSRCPVPPHGDLSCLSYEQSLDPEAVENIPVSSSPSLVYSADVDMSGDVKTEFRFEEFPKQHEAHRYVAQQLPCHKPKQYSFNNTTPNTFLEGTT
ncbi:hypothetical protein P168DRAFT_279545 [Aspergillus campestris IBT 28561]|uniref:Homeobox domain-containing protein n=1 Tax=Aspergillus campestris (strain IBT 28561) TaxID=1392248 RepID=A0A2I1DCH8_ASPC2|nr:uncharacterized protein P168DRAFT_279545 [Aspergillus campestris IBT 28561]PKY07588.1 hypothetical protein P168DRAFT_279545 [Aspergillus campestris IBT 28561]